MWVCDTHIYKINIVITISICSFAAICKKLWYNYCAPGGTIDDSKGSDVDDHGMPFSDSNVVFVLFNEVVDVSWMEDINITV